MNAGFVLRRAFRPSGELVGRRRSWIRVQHRCAGGKRRSGASRHGRYCAGNRLRRVLLLFSAALSGDDEKSRRRRGGGGASLEIRRRRRPRADVGDVAPHPHWRCRAQRVGWSSSTVVRVHRSGRAVVTRSRGPKEGWRSIRRRRRRPPPWSCGSSTSAIESSYPSNRGGSGSCME
jgi:hypothetical protein